MYVEGQQYNFSHPNRGNYKKTRLLNCLRFQLTRNQKESDWVYACVKVFFFLTSAFVIQTAQEWGWGSVSLLASLLELNDRRVSSVSLCTRRSIRYNVVIDNFILGENFNIFLPWSRLLFSMSPAFIPFTASTFISFKLSYIEMNILNIFHFSLIYRESNSLFSYTSHAL